MESLARDLRYALTIMARNRGFAATTLLTLALGIGMTTAVFSVVHGVLLKPLPYPGADRLVRVWEEHPGGTPITTDRWISNRTFHAWTERGRTLDVLGGYGTYESTVAVNHDAHRMFGARVSPALLGAVGAKPVAGRLFSADEGEEGRSGVILISHHMWTEAFGSNAQAVGQPVRVDGESRTIVGVLASDFYFPDRRARFWLPYVVPRVSADPQLSQRTSALSAIARVAAGATAAQVEAEGTLYARSVPVTMATQLLFGKGGPPSVHAVSLASDMTASVRPALLVLAAAVGCILLIACINVANLFLSRGVARQRELALRAAIGAGATRLVRQLLTEAVVFSVAGGILGLALAWAFVRLLPHLAPAQFPRVDDVRIDPQVLLAAAGAVLLTTLASGLLPAIRGARFDVFGSLHGGDGAVAGGFRGRRARRTRDVLLLVEAAFAVTLLVCAGLLARSFVRLIHVDPGYAPEHVLTVRVHMPTGATPDRVAGFIETAVAALRAAPGVRAAGASNMMPLVPMTAMGTFTLPADARRDTPTQTRQLSYTVTPGYGEAIGLRLRQGRLFDHLDVSSGVRAMIVNDEFARRYLDNAPAIGLRFRNLFPTDANRETEIIGVVGTVLKDGHDRRPEPEVYFVQGPPESRIAGAVNFVVRTAAEPALLAPMVRKTIGSIDRAVIIERVEPLTDRLSVSVAQPRFAATVVVIFAVTALALASIGLYGVLSYAVSQRRRELSLRAALGASRGHMLRLVIGEGLSVTAAGLAVGLAAAAALTRWMQSILFGVTPLDAVSFTAAPVILMIVAFGACLRPALRAARSEPAAALRSE
jgi:predicted permease